MPYFQDSELDQYVEREILPGLAEDCVTEFYERFGVWLDGSPGSLDLIDRVIAASPELEQDALVGPIGAYLAAVFSGSDGARWAPAFHRRSGIDGYTSSRLNLYNSEIDVFSLARQALEGATSLAESFRTFHRPAPCSRKRSN